MAGEEDVIDVLLSQRMQRASQQMDTDNTMTAEQRLLNDIPPDLRRR